MISITGLKLKDVLKRLSTHVEMESQAAVLRVRPELERDDSEALRNVATCRAVLKSRVADICRSLPEMADAVAGFDEYIAGIEPEQTEEAESN